MRSRPRPARRHTVAVLLAAAVAISVAACGSSASSGGSGGGGVSTSSGGGAASTSTSSPATTSTHAATTTKKESSAAAHTSSASGGGSAASSAGLQVFESAGCGSCHTLAAAHATGTVGPNLDQLKPSESLVALQVTHGGGAMPSFADKLSKAQIAAVAKFVASAAG